MLRVQHWFPPSKLISTTVLTYCDQDRSVLSGLIRNLLREKSAVSWVCCSRRQMSEASKEIQQVPAHYVARTSWWGPHFTNPWDTWTGDKTLSDLSRFGKEQRKINQLGWLRDNPQPSEADFRRAFPLVPPDVDALAHPVDSTIQALWVGHATVLVQMGGVAFLTDPVFSQRCSPTQLIGPRRIVPPALTPDYPSFPSLDFILISHNHYDHLDLASVKQLHQRYPGLKWYVPLKLGDWFRDVLGEGVKVVELDWWQSVQHDGGKVEVVFVPAQHWSARGIWDRRRTLWGGFVVKAPSAGTFYFVGDTGYCPVFSEIGDRLGPMDLSAIPIGAYSPRWFMKPQHVDPFEAVQIHEDVKSKRSMAIHFGTFCLTTEALDEPPELLREAREKRGLKEDDFVALQHGAIIRSGP